LVRFFAVFSGIDFTGTRFPKKPLNRQRPILPKALRAFHPLPGRGPGEISPNLSRVEPLNPRQSIAAISSRRGNNVSLSLGERAGVRAGIFIPSPSFRFLG
jgi:hypothetical protein